MVVHEKENKQPPLDLLSSNRISPVFTENIINISSQQTG